MKNKEDLFKLIQAMSRSEKRYFTLDAQKSGRKPNKYLELFQAINEMETYDEERLRQQFGRSLPSDKSYLYDAVLRSLRDYHAAKSRATKIKDFLLDAKLLYERGLYEQSEERLLQARQLAVELDDQLALFQIGRELIYHAWTMKKKDYGGAIEVILGENARCIANVEEELKYLALAYRIQIARGKPEITQNPEKIEQLFPAELFEADQQPESAHARRRFLQSAACYYDLIEDFDQANAHYYNMVKWWDGYPAIKEEEYVRYLADVFNLLHASYSQKKYQQFEDLLKKIEQERPSSYHDQRMIFKQLTNYKLLYHINFGILEGHEELARQVEEGMAAYKLNPVSQLIIAFNLALLFFILGRFELCQRWAEKVLRDYNRGVNNPGFRLGAHLLGLLAAFDSDDVDRLDSALRAMQRTLKASSKEERGTFFDLAARYIKRLGNAPPKQALALLREFEAAIQVLRGQGEESFPLGLDELVLAWIKSRREGQPMQVIVRQAAAGN
jgi:hypothetical protein